MRSGLKPPQLELLCVRTQALLKKSMPKALGHITSLKQLTELQLTPAPAGGSRPVDSTSFQPGNDAPFICPITEVPLNGRFRAFVLQPSRLVVSERAIKEVRDIDAFQVGHVARQDLECRRLAHRSWHCWVVIILPLGTKHVTWCCCNLAQWLVKRMALLSGSSHFLAERFCNSLARHYYQCHVPHDC